MKSPKLVAAMMLSVAVALLIGSQVYSVDISAQTKTEICGNGIDDDGDKLIDEGCKEEGTPCSPGWYKNHVSEWYPGACCGNEGQRSCEELLTAVSCTGRDSTCGRSAAAAYLNACSGCTE